MFTQMRLRFAWAMLLFCASYTSVSFADQSAHSELYAQQLVQQTMPTQADLLDIIFHVTRPGTAENYAVAAYTDHERGQKSGADDIGVIMTGVPLVEVQKDGVRVGVVLPLKDNKGSVIGALGVMYRYHDGEDTGAFLKRAEMTRDELAKKIPSLKSLFAQIRSQAN